MLARTLRVGYHLIMAAIALLWVFPFLWMLIGAIRPDRETFQWPPKLLPSEIIWTNFTRVLERASFARYFSNSLILALAEMVGVVVLGAMAGYAFARLRFPGDKVLFYLLLAKMMVPTQATLIPLFLLIKKVPLAGGNNIMGAGGTGWLNSWAGLITPHLVTAFSIFMFKQFFSTLPKDTEDAARIDGCSEWQLYWRMVLPQSGPVLATMALFSFQHGWNSFLWPLVSTTKEHMRTIQIGLTAYQQTHGSDWGLLMAGSTLAALPILIVFLIGQRYFIRGISMSGLKG